MLLFFRNNEVKFREDLMNIARTTLSSKILTQYKDYFSKLAVDAVLRLKVRQSADCLSIYHRWFCKCYELFELGFSSYNFASAIDVLRNVFLNLISE